MSFNESTKPVTGIPWKGNIKPDSYPGSPRTYAQIVKNVDPLPFHNVSGSNWTGEHLLGLRILAMHSRFGHRNHKRAFRKAGIGLDKNKALKDVLIGLRDHEIHRGDPQMISLLEERDATLGYTCYTGIRELSEGTLKPIETSDRVLRDMPAVNYAPTSSFGESISTASVSTAAISLASIWSSDSGSAYVLSSRGSQNPQSDFPEKDELATTRTVTDFLHVICGLSAKAAPVPNPKSKDPVVGEAEPNQVFQPTLAQQLYGNVLRPGSFRSKTDGGIHIVEVDEDGDSHRVEGIETVIDIEAKAASTVELLPQHVAELVSHMTDRLSKRKATLRVDTWDKMSVAQRTVYLLCFNQTHFRVVWATFRPDYLEWLYGALGTVKELIDSPYKKDRPLPQIEVPQHLYQPVQVSPPAELTKVQDRIIAAKVIICLVLLRKIPTDEKSDSLDDDILGPKSSRSNRRNRHKA